MDVFGSGVFASAGGLALAVGLSGLDGSAGVVMDLVGGVDSEFFEGAAGFAVSDVGSAGLLAVELSLAEGVVATLEPAIEKVEVVGTAAFCDLFGVGDVDEGRFRFFFFLDEGAAAGGSNIMPRST